MKWIEKLKDSVITFLSSLMVICSLPKVQGIAQEIAIFLSVDEKNFTRVETATISFFVGFSYFILRVILTLLERIFKSLVKKAQVNVEFFDKRNKPISELKFKKRDEIYFESKFIRLKFMLRLPKIPLKIIKSSGGRLRVSFNPNLINCELDNGFLHANGNDNFCYREGKDIYINLFSLYGPSEDPISNSLDFNIQPLQKSTSKLSIEIVPKKSNGRLGMFLYFFNFLLLKITVTIKQQNIILKS